MWSRAGPAAVSTSSLVTDIGHDVANEHQQIVIDLVL
jgi:hypothetical protein